MADPVTAIAAAVGVANAASKAVTGKSLAEHGKALAETLRAKLMGKIGAEVGAVVEGLLPAEKEAKVWDIETGECVATLEGHSNYVYSVAVFPDGRRVVSASRDETLKVWDVATGKCVATLKGHSNEVTSVAVFPDGRRVVSGSADNTLKYWGLPK